MKNTLKKQYIDIIILVILIALLFIGFFSYVIFHSLTSKKDNLDTTLPVSSTYETSLSNSQNSNFIEYHDEVVDIDALPTNELLEEKVSEPITVKVTGTTPYFIKVNYLANVVTIYSKDEFGYYTVPFKAMICSTGTATPKFGTYTISEKYRWLSLVGGVKGQYSSRIVNHILFHSVPYLKETSDSLEYWEYDKLGKSASAGCIRLTVEDAKWIYDNCRSGTKVEFYSDENPGPLGKPTSRQISSNVECRNWDPTDPNSNNPWRKYLNATN